MGIGAVFILLVVLAVLAVLGGGLYAIAAWLRGRQLDPEEDKVERSSRERRASPARERPTHVRVESGQHARFSPR